MIVHFICDGNNYRSRLAETYLNSLQIPGVSAISSGINASEDGTGPISWLAQRIIQNNKLIRFEKDHWDQTNQENLDKGDLTVFMTHKNLDWVKANLNFNSDKYEVWNINDIEGTETEEEKIRKTEETFEVIKQKVDELIKK